MVFKGGTLGGGLDRVGDGRFAVCFNDVSYELMGIGRRTAVC